MDALYNDITRISRQLLPQEEMLERAKQPKKIIIGIPKEASENEDRIPLIPETITQLVELGHEILIEKDAGMPAHYSNEKYQLAGAKIVSSKQEVYEADLIIKVAPPTMEELELIKPKKTILSSLHWTNQPEAYFRKLMSKKITALAFETIMDEHASFPVIRSMGEIAGTTSIMIAAEYLSSKKYGRGSILGGFSGIAPSEVIILGAGTVGEFATRAALGMGATVKVFDNSIFRLRRLQNSLNERIYTSTIQPQTLAAALKSADVVIGAIRPINGRSPLIVTEDIVQNMKYGTVIIDVSIDHGGCIETSRLTKHSNPVYRIHDVTHYCVPNMASRVPHTASRALSNIFGPIIISIGNFGGIDTMLRTDYGVRQGVYIYKGALTDRNIGSSFSIPSQDIDLLLSAMI
ncbi:MAG: alanine dehydrogenase [Bacteroidales bacterium]|nr:alanine dehydrogenase [Bacteroidales bacterium]